MTPKSPKKKARSKKVKLPANVMRMLSDLRSALMGWGGNLDDRDDTNWADVTLTPSEVRRMWRIIDRYAPLKGNTP